MPSKLDTSQLAIFSSNNGSSLAPGERRSKIPRTVNLRIRGVKRPPSSPPTQRYATPHKTNNRRQEESQAVICVGVEGREIGEFVNPQGVSVFGDKILVADSNNNCIQVCNYYVSGHTVHPSINMLCTLASLVSTHT